MKTGAKHCFTHLNTALLQCSLYGGACLVTAMLSAPACLPSSWLAAGEGVGTPQGLAHWPPLLAAKSKWPGRISHLLVKPRLFPAEPCHLNLSCIWNTHHCPEVSPMGRWWHNVVGRYATELHSYKWLKWYIIVPCISPQ